MQFLATFLIFNTFGFLQVSLADAGDYNITAVGSDGEFSTCNILKTKYEILKLRLDIIEKFGSYEPDIDKKLKYLDDKVHNLYTALYTRGESNQSHLEYVLTEGRGNTSTSSAFMEDTQRLPSEEMLTDTPDNGVDYTEHDHLFLTNIDDDDDPKVCRSSENGANVCSKIQLPSSCDMDDLACRNNKCRIQVNQQPSFTIPCVGRWIVIQRRINGSVDFNRDWLSYKNGFGDLDGEFWLGLDKIHALTEALAPVELFIHMEDFDGQKTSATYTSFSIGDESTKYILTPGQYSGTAGDALHIHRQEAFTTIDNDNDKNSGTNCAQALSGGWWFYECKAESDTSNLNGQYFSKDFSRNISRKNGITWSTYRSAETSLKFVEMMIRHKN